MVVEFILFSSSQVLLNKEKQLLHMEKTFIEMFGVFTSYDNEICVDQLTDWSESENFIVYHDTTIENELR